MPSTAINWPPPASKYKFCSTPIPQERMRVRVLDKLPEHDTIWDLCMAPDDTLYIGACLENFGGGSAWLCTYRADTDKIEYLVDMSVLTGECVDSGRPTQGKIHFSLNYDENGLIYGATHCTTAPMGEKMWSPFTNYADSIRSFTGAHLFVYDPKTREAKCLGIPMPREGIRVMVLDAKRRVFHGTSFPKNHYFIYDLNTMECRDLGRVGNSHQVAMVMDNDGNGYVTDNFGHLVRCKAETYELEYLGVQTPVTHRNGEQNYSWQMVVEPKTGMIYGINMEECNTLWRYDPKTNRMEDLGPTYGFVNHGPYGYTSADMAGGLVFGMDGFLYYDAKENDTPQGSVHHLIRYDTNTGDQTELGVIVSEGVNLCSVTSHAKADSKGNLFFADSATTPPRMFIYLNEGSL